MPPVADPINFFSFFSFFFGVKLCHFTINDFFLFVTNAQAYQRKTEKFLAKKKSFIGSATGHQHNGPSQYVKKSFSSSLLFCWFNCLLISIGLFLYPGCHMDFKKPYLTTLKLFPRNKMLFKS